MNVDRVIGKALLTDVSVQRQRNSGLHYVKVIEWNWQKHFDVDIDVIHKIQQFWQVDHFKFESALYSSRWEGRSWNGSREYTYQPVFNQGGNQMTCSMIKLCKVLTIIVVLVVKCQTNNLLFRFRFESLVSKWGQWRWCRVVQGGQGLWSLFWTKVSAIKKWWN